jgi:ABC-type branched-subunit amino acid transport system substrate-binding protein
VNSRRSTVALAAVALSIALAACGSSSSSSDSKTAAATSTASTAATPTSTPTGAAIKIGAIEADSSSLPAGTAPEATSGVQAAVDAINAAGGIKGHKLDLINCNDQADPNTAVSCVNSELSQGIVAVVGSIGPETAGIYPILQKAGVASIGPVPTSPAIGDSPVATCFTPAVAGGFVGLPQLLKQRGASVQSLIYPNDYGAASKLIVTSFQLGLKKAGVKLGAIAGYASTTTEFGPVVGTSLSGGASGIVAFAPGATSGPLVASILSADPKAKVAIAASGWLPSVAKYLGAKGNGVYAVGFQMPSTSSAPGIKEFNAQMSKYAPTAARDDSSIGAWAAVDAFQEIAAKLPTTDRASVLKAFSSFSDLTTGGIFPPMSKNPAHPFTGMPGDTCVANPTVVFEIVRNGQLYPIKDGQFTNPFTS